MKESLNVKGSLKIYKNGKLERGLNNLVVSTGLDWIAARLYDTAIPDQVSHMNVGTGTTAPDSADTDLETPKTPRVALTSTTVTDSEIEYVATFSGTTYNGALTEAGLFNALTGATMVSRVTFAAVNVGSSDSISITWTLSLANA